MGVYIDQALNAKPDFVRGYELFEQAMYGLPTNTSAKILWVALNNNMTRIDLLAEEADGGLINLHDYGYTKLWVNLRGGGPKQEIGDALNDTITRFKAGDPRDLAAERLGLQIVLKTNTWDRPFLSSAAWRTARYAATLAHEFVIHAAYYARLLLDVAQIGTRNDGSIRHARSIWNGLGDERDQHRAVFANDQYGLHDEYRDTVQLMIRFTNDNALKQALDDYYREDVKEHGEQDTVLGLIEKAQKFKF